MIDGSKIKTGDEVTVRVKVERAEVDGRILCDLRPFGLFMATLGVIDKHIPAPRPFEKGDPVTWGDGSKRATFLMSHGGTAFIAHKDDSPGTAELSALRHADAAPEDEIVVTDDEVRAARHTFFHTQADCNVSMRAALIDFLKRRKEVGR